MELLGIDLTNGDFAFLAFIVVMLVGFVTSVYTRTGSGIAQRPYHRRYGDAPGANHRSSRLSGHEDATLLSSRGTK
jgi:hypothetical protein